MSHLRGVEVWQYSDGNENIKKFCKEICNDVSKIFNIRNRGLKFSKELSVLKNTKMPAALIEVDFISNTKAEKDLKVSENIKAVALAIKNNLLELFGLEVNESEILYRVCIGAYRNKNNAMKQVELSRKRGFENAYIIKN